MPSIGNYELSLPEFSPKHASYRKKTDNPTLNYQHVHVIGPLPNHRYISRLTSAMVYKQYIRVGALSRGIGKKKKNGNNKKL